MRCLYCGVELALLKKLAGSDNFCSDAHRLAYQEEFSRLALNRLMQSQPHPAKKTQDFQAGPAITEQASDDRSYTSLNAVKETLLNQRTTVSNGNGGSKQFSAAVLEPVPAVEQADLDPEEAGFLKEFPATTGALPKPITNEGPMFRFTQYAMPELKVPIVDETSLSSPALFRRPKRLPTESKEFPLSLMEELAFPIPMNLVTSPFRTKLEKQELPGLELEISRLEYIDFLRNSQGASVAPVQEQIIVTAGAFEEEQPPQSATPTGLPEFAKRAEAKRQVPPRFEELAGLTASNISFSPMEPASPSLAPALRDISFATPEIVNPEINLVTLHAAITFANKPQPAALASGPVAKQVPMTQEPPPTLPDVLPKTRIPAEGKKQNGTNPQAVPLPNLKLEPGNIAPKIQKPKLSLPGPVDELPQNPSLPEFRVEGAANTRRGIPHPSPVDAHGKAMIPKPRALAPDKQDTDAASDSQPEEFNMTGEIGTDPNIITMVPSWIKKMLFASLVGAGAFLGQLSYDASPLKVEQAGLSKPQSETATRSTI